MPLYNVCCSVTNEIKEKQKVPSDILRIKVTLCGFLFLLYRIASYCTGGRVSASILDDNSQ